ncbi:Uncharacterised protein [uncultured archaeon]|nr:Uncharacterised protein [uncultured archaeon]
MSSKFKPITLNDKPLFDGFFRKHPQKISEYTFTNLFCWRRMWNYRYAVIDGHLIVESDEKQGPAFYPPVGPDPAGMIKALSKEYPDWHFSMVEEDVALKLKDSFLVRKDEDQRDYVYLTEDLRALPGTKYSVKRNFIRRCQQHNPEVCALSDERVREFIEMQERWCDEHKCLSNNQLTSEDDAIKQLLTNHKKLGVLGVCVTINGQLEAFALGEPINPSTYIEHFEKASVKYDGLYQFVLHEFAKSIPPQFKFLNREQDLGVAGLRKAKLSWHPVGYVEKYSLLPSASD